MPVGEATPSAGKSASGERSCQPAHTSSSDTNIETNSSTLRALTALALALVIAAMPLHTIGQIIGDPKAPADQRPTILSDPQGRPLIHIQTPSTAGLSRNTYSQFDVPAQGAILNNSASNPWLANGVLARTILNEVNSSLPSTINGAVIVHGAPAQVVVANPNGITINGGSFINASRATLTTGIPQLENGVLSGFKVRGGVINVAGGSLNNSATPYTDLLSRAVILTGKVQAQNLAITTGLQTVAHDSGQVTDQDTNTYAAGALSIDTAALGGMYANNISIVATEAGVGVRNQGAWQATGGQIVVTADGLLQNLGTISARVASLATVNGNMENAGAIQATQLLVGSSGGDMRLFGAGLKQAAGSTVILSAKGAMNLYHSATYGAAQVSSDAEGGRINLSARENIHLNPGASVSANENIQLSSDAFVVASGANIAASKGKVTVLAGAGLGVTDSNVSGQQVHLESGSAFSDNTAALLVQNSRIHSANQTALLASDSILIANAQSTAVGSEGNVHIQADKAVNIGAGGAISAGNHMSIIAGTALNLQAVSGNTASNGLKVGLSAGGNMLISGSSVNATGSTLTAGNKLSIEATGGPLGLHGLANASGSSIDRLILRAGEDLNISAYKGSLYATALQANARNINLLSNGTTSLAHATVRQGSSTQAVGSTLTAREDITVGSVSRSEGESSQVQLVASSLQADGQARVLSQGTTLITAVANTADGVNTPARSSINAGSVVIEGRTVQTDAADIRSNGDKSSAARSGDIWVTATGGSAIFNVHTGYRSQFNSSGNLLLHANGDLTHWYTYANARGSLSSTSGTGRIQGVGSILLARDMLSLASKGPQTHAGAYYNGGAVSIYNESGHLALKNSRVQATGTATTGLARLSGQASIESGATLELDADSVLVADTDLSIIQGKGDITIHPDKAARGSFAWKQFGVNRNLTLATRDGNLLFTGIAGSDGVGSSSNVGLYVKGDLNLSANNVSLQGSRLYTGGALRITATSGDVRIQALPVTQAAAGFTNQYWDYAQLVGAKGVSVRAAGHIAMDSVYAQSDAGIHIESGGDTTIAGNYSRWTVDNRAGNGWFQDEKGLWQSFIDGKGGVHIAALGGNLTLSATSINAANGKLSLKALGNINLEAAQEHQLHQASSWRSYRKCNWLVVCNNISETTYHHREYLKNKPVSLFGQDIEIKAGNNISTYGTRLHASRYLNMEAGDAIHYYAVYDQQDISDTTYQKKSLWGLVTWDRNTTTNTSTKLSGQPTVLQSLGDILSSSGGNQLLQGTRVSYGGHANFQAGVGEKARSDARIILEGLKNSVYQQRTQKSDYLVWQELANNGSYIETLAMPSFSGPRLPVFSAPGGLTVQIPAGELRTQIQALAQQPGMAYLNTLAQRNDVNWQPVKLAYDQWNYRQSGLTPAGAALVAIAVTWALGPGGASVIGNAATTTAVMTDAALASLASQASISLINNKGDVGKTLRELGSSRTAKATIAAVLTAGVLDKLGAINGMSEIRSKLQAGTAGFSEKLAFNLINATGRALTNTAIQGGNLEDTLRQALIGGIVDTAHGQVASVIKGLEADYLTHKLAHALAGCAAGAATGGQCKDGAIGAAVAEMMAELMPPRNGIAYSDSEKANVLAVSKLVAGAASAYAGGNAQTAINTAETAVQNNAFVPLLIGLVWLADKAWTAYEVAQDVAAIRDGTKTVEQVALEKGDEYVTGIILGNIGRQGYKVGKKGIKHIREGSSSSEVKKVERLGPNAGAVESVEAFLKSPGFGSYLADNSRRLARSGASDHIRKADKKINEHIRKGDVFYLDNHHMNHIEVFDAQGKATAVLNLDGSINEAKSKAAKGRRISL